MARKPMVTRTMRTTKAIIGCIRIEDETVVPVEVVLPRVYHNDVAIMKQALESYDFGDLKPAYVKESRVEEKRYGMTEDDFIQHAQELTGSNEEQQ